MALCFGLMAFVMNYLAIEGSKTSYRDGIELGVMLWIGFGAPFVVISNAFDPHGNKLATLVDMCAYLVIFIVQGICVAKLH